MSLRNSFSTGPCCHSVSPDKCMPLHQHPRSARSYLMFSLRNPSAAQQQHLRCTANDLTPVAVKQPTNGTPPSLQQPKDTTGISNDQPSLQSQFSLLAAQVAQQQQLITQQHKQLLKLQTEADAAARIAQQQGPSSRSGSSTMLNRAAVPMLSPFALQAQAFGDRRLLGQYDSRFHSTNKWVLLRVAFHTFLGLIFFAWHLPSNIPHNSKRNQTRIPRPRRPVVP